MEGSLRHVTLNKRCVRVSSTVFVICVTTSWPSVGAGLVLQWEQQSGLLFASGDVKHILVWDSEKEMKVQVLFKYLRSSDLMLHCNERLCMIRKWRQVLTVALRLLQLMRLVVPYWSLDVAMDQLGCLTDVVHLETGELLESMCVSNCPIQELMCQCVLESCHDAEGTHQLDCERFCTDWKRRKNHQWQVVLSVNVLTLAVHLFTCVALTVK